MKYLMGAILLIVISLCSCSAQRVSENASGNTLLSHSIVIGESGGFTGNNSGYSIDSTGLVKRFEGFVTTTASEKEKGRLNKEQIQRINDLIPELLKSKYSEKGNLTSYITLRRNGVTSRYSWSGPTPGKNVPETLSRFYTEVKSIINSL